MTSLELHQQNTPKNYPQAQKAQVNVCAGLLLTASSSSGRDNDIFDKS